MTAARLIELLAMHIQKHGNTDVDFIHYEDEVRRVSIDRCWFDDDEGHIVVGPT